MSTTTVRERPPAAQPDSSGLPSSGGGPARRAVMRWAWRLFRREWRQQLLVLALLTVAVAATTFGVAAATNVTHTPRTSFIIPGSDPQLAADVAAIEQRFGPADVVHHRKLPIPGSVSATDVRSQDTVGGQARPTLRLVSGRYPKARDEVALTRDMASTFGVKLGGTWSDRGQASARRVVGLVENPESLSEQFALVVPGQADPADHVTVVLRSAPVVSGFHLPSNTPLQIESESANARTASTVTVLAMATVSLLFVGLVAVAGFTVMAQRRMRALGMLGSIGAGDNHVQLVMLTNGLVVGLAAAAVGAVLGLGGWLAFAPRMERLAGHRIDRFDLPWWAVGIAVVLAVLTAVAAAWWPGRAAARIPVVAALSGRPPRPQPGRRFAASGSVLLAVGVGFLFLSRARRPVFVIFGAMITVVGVLLLAPLAIRALARVGRRAPIAVRLSLRDLVRYQARSGAALAAVTLALAIAVAIAVSAAAHAASTGSSVGNLPSNALVVHLGGPDKGPLLPEASAGEVQAAEARVNEIAASVHATNTVLIDGAANMSESDAFGPDAAKVGPDGKDGAALVKAIPHGYDLVAPLSVATPELLAYQGIAPGRVDPTADVLTRPGNASGVALRAGRDRLVDRPNVQHLPLSIYPGEQNRLITMHAVERLGLQLVPAGWLIRTPRPLTPAQIGVAQNLASPGGLFVETRKSSESRAQLGRDATLIGLAFALAVLAMTVGLIRSETAADLRTLTATGAGAMARRTLTGATAGALAFLGALMGTAGAYLALVAWHRSDEWTLAHVPYFNLVIVLVGLPVLAVLGGWLLAGREPPAIARRPLE